MGEKSLKGLIEYEGKTFWIDMTKKDWEFKTIDPDGTVRPMDKKDADLMDVIAKGHVIGDKLPS